MISINQFTELVTNFDSLCMIMATIFASISAVLAYFQCRLMYEIHTTWRQDERRQAALEVISSRSFFADGVIKTDDERAYMSHILNKIRFVFKGDKTVENALKPFLVKSTQTPEEIVELIKCVCQIGGILTEAEASNFDMETVMTVRRSVGQMNSHI